MKRKEIPEALEFFARTKAAAKFYVHFSHKMRVKGDITLAKEIKKPVNIFINNRYPAPDEKSPAVIWLFIMTNNYAASEFARLNYMLYHKELISKNELEILNETIRLFIKIIKRFEKKLKQRLVEPHEYLPMHNTEKYYKETNSLQQQIEE